MNSLKSYLQTNAIFSGISGLLILIFNNGFLMEYLGLKNPKILMFIGVGLLIFSAFIFYVVKKQIDNSKLISIITSLDIMWVLGSFSITFFDLFGITQKSQPLINFVALWVGLLASGQLYYLRKQN